MPPATTRSSRPRKSERAARARPGPSVCPGLSPAACGATRRSPSGPRPGCRRDGPAPGRVRAGPPGLRPRPGSGRRTASPCPSRIGRMRVTKAASSPRPGCTTRGSPVRSSLLQASLADRDDGSGGPSRMRRRAGTQGATKMGACARFKRSPRCHCGDATRRMAGSPLRGPLREAVSVSGERSVSRIKAGSRRSLIAGSPFHPPNHCRGRCALRYPR